MLIHRVFLYLPFAISAGAMPKKTAAVRDLGSKARHRVRAAGEAAVSIRFSGKAHRLDRAAEGA